MPMWRAPAAQSERNIAPFNPGQSWGAHFEVVRRFAVATAGIEHRPIQKFGPSVAGLRNAGGNRPDRTSPHSIRGRVACWGGPVRVWALRIPAATVGTEHRLIQLWPSCVSHPSPTAPLAVWGTVAVDEAWKTHYRCRFGRVGSAAGPRIENTIGSPTPGDTEADSFVINGTALTGLSTHCPRRRSSTNRVAVGKGWVTPTTTSAGRRSDSRERRPYRNIAPFNRPRAARRKPGDTVDIYSI